MKDRAETHKISLWNAEDEYTELPFWAPWPPGFWLARRMCLPRRGLQNLFLIALSMK